MRDNGLPYFRPGENRDAEMAEGLQVLEAQERERIYQERMRLWAAIAAEEQRLDELVDDYEADLQDRLEDHAEMLESQERERDCGDADEWDSPTREWVR